MGNERGNWIKDPTTQTYYIGWAAWDFEHLYEQFKHSFKLVRLDTVRTLLSISSSVL